MQPRTSTFVRSVQTPFGSAPTTEPPKAHGYGPTARSFASGTSGGSSVGGLYNNWNGGEPNDFGFFGEDCAAMLTSGLWNDNRCTRNRRYICEGPPVCGNGVRGDGEECDDGNLTNGDGCDDSCEVEGAAVCGDGNVWAPEECDDDNTTAGDGCSDTCTVESGYTCTGEPSICTFACGGGGAYHSQMGSTTTEYLYCGTATTGATAASECEALGAGWALTRINDSTENTYVNGLSGVNKWIGANDIDSEGVWVWRDDVQFWSGDSTGSSVGGLYENWNGGKPNDYGSGEDCAEMYTSGVWNDLKCTSTSRYVCEGPPICGNGAVALPQNCDDGNTTNGDGCADDCTVEAGYECELPDDMGTPSVCSLSADVKIGSTRLLRGNAGSVFQWETTSEAGTVDFIVSRQQPNGSWHTLHEGVLLATHTSPQGGTYTLLDARQRRNSGTYRIEELQASGKRTVAGLFEVNLERTTFDAPLRRGFARLPRRRLLRPTQTTQTVLKHVITADAAGVVLNVENDALLEVSLVDIASIWQRSIDLLATAAATGELRLTLFGEPRPYIFDATTNTIRFAGEASTSVYSGFTPYVLTLNTDTSDRDPSSPPGAPSMAPTEVWVEAVHDPNLFAGLVVSPDPDSDYWYGGVLSPGSDATYNTEFAIEGSDASEATLQVRLYGAWDFTGETEHDISVSINGTLVDVVSVQTDGPQIFDVALPPGPWTIGEYEVEIQSLEGSPGTYGYYVDQIRMRTLKTIALATEAQRFESPLNGIVRIECDSEAFVFDVTNGNPLPVSMHDGSAYVRLEEAKTYLTATAFSSPQSMRALPIIVELTAADEAVYVIVTGSSLAGPANRLEKLRELDGLRSATVDIETIYDAYADSLPTPHALVAFFKDVAARGKLRYALLLGDGTFDYRDRLGEGPGIIAPLMSQTKAGLYATDATFADVDLDTLPDFAIGRIPARTVREADEAIDRIVAYSTVEFGPDALLLAGGDRGTKFSEFSQAIADQLPGSLSYSQSTRGDGAEVDSIAELLSDSPYWVNYIGHGGLDRLDDDGWLSIDDLPLIKVNVDAPMLFTTITCSTSRHELPGAPSLGEAMVLNDGPAIAVWGPTGLTLSNDTAALSKSLARSLWQDAEPDDRLGDVLVRTVKNADSSLGAGQIYTLLGDPALPIRSLTKPRTEGDGGVGGISGSDAGLSSGSCTVSYDASQHPFSSPGVVLTVLALLFLRRTKRAR